MARGLKWDNITPKGKEILQGRNQKSYRESAHQIQTDLGVVQRVVVAVFY